MTARLRKQAVGVKDDLREMGVTVKEAAQERLQGLRRDATAQFEEGRDKVAQASQTFEHYVGEHPLKSMLIAAGVGLLFGRFWMRR